jgi:hypothetical protein
MLTEAALGRATDHLYQALPKAIRKELAALPDTVHRLERNATSLRASVDSCDEHLAAFERSGRRDPAVETELRDARDLAADRLAQTIAALESIRLDLLRLQMGRVGVESVTASLAAAQRVGAQIAFVVEARDEVERLLETDKVQIPRLAPLARDDGVGHRTPARCDRWAATVRGHMHGRPPRIVGGRMPIFLNLRTAQFRVYSPFAVVVTERLAPRNIQSFVGPADWIEVRVTMVRGTAVTR